MAHPPDVNSGGTLRNVPPLLSHRSLYAVSFDDYVIALAITAVVLIWRNHKRSQEDTVYHEEFSEEEDEHEE